MAVVSIGLYDFPPADRVENYGGDINLYCCWEQHLLIPCPAAYRLPPTITLRDFLTQMFAPDHAHHPEFARVDFAAVEWTLDGKPWQPALDRSLADNGVTHMSYLSFRSPGLEGFNRDGI